MNSRGKADTPGMEYSGSLNSQLLIAMPGMADPNFVREQTGFAIGGVPPVGHLQALTIFIDEDLLQYEEIWAAAGTPHAVFRLTPDELKRITNGTVISIK